jgi:hypothetical protein
MLGTIKDQKGKNQQCRSNERGPKSLCVLPGAYANNQLD